MSISVGAAVFPHDGDTYETLLAAADRRMYQDKSARRRDVHRQLAGGGLESSAAPAYDTSVA